jgi:DNA polymerase V
VETKAVIVNKTDQATAPNEAILFASRPAAGFPSLGDDSIEESLNLHTFMVTNPTATFFVKVYGDSMEGAKIFDNDILVVNRSLHPKSGAIVVAAVNGELVVKRLKKTSQGVCLVSENETYQPIILGESDDCFVWGVVTGTVRKLA